MRTLDLMGRGIKEMPENVGVLQHLEHLGKESDSQRAMSKVFLLIFFSSSNLELGPRSLWAPYNLDPSFSIKKFSRSSGVPRISSKSCSKYRLV